MSTATHGDNRGQVIPFDPKLIDVNPLNDDEIKRLSQFVINSHKESVTGDNRAAWLLRAVTCIDLTTLAGDDTEANVVRLCHKALRPLRKDVVEKLGIEDMNLTCGAVCVYPARVKGAFDTIKLANSNLPVASVATGFPTGQTSLKVRLDEIKFAVDAGATEIDVVINRECAIRNDWRALYDELVEMRKACGTRAHLKTILAVGELGNFTEVYKASMVSMMAGSDFIKTSTGKEPTNATIPVGVVMCRAIKDFEKATGIRVGLKPAGGIRTADDAISWLLLVKLNLGDEWLNNEMFRIGASGLLGDIEKALYVYAFGHYPVGNPLPLA